MSDFWWSPENVETLEKLWREGLSAAQISARMGDTTRNAVIGKLHRLGLSGHGRVTVVRKPHAWRTPQARQRNIAAPRGHAAEAFRQRKREISSGARPVFAASAEPLPPWSISIHTGDAYFCHKSTGISLLATGSLRSPSFLNINT